MSAVLVIGLVLIILALGGLVLLRQHRLIEDLKRAREELQLEENRVFDFLHGLGEAFSEDVRVADLHRLIVEGAIRILDAQGGVLYLADRSGKVLLPAFLSKECPPFIEVPATILRQSNPSNNALESYLRLHSIRPAEGLLGVVWEKREPLFISDADDHFGVSGVAPTLRSHSIMAGPLIYGRENLGVLAVANPSSSASFSPPDFVVFQSIVEQSAFALYNAMIYSEAAEKRRIDRDLSTARDIQRILLPAAPPLTPGFEIASLNIAASHVSGDYYDYIKIDDRRVGIAIADVSGKGVSASLIMAMCRSVLRSTALTTDSAATVLQHVNRQLYPDIKEDMFISMAYLILDLEEKKIHLARAGHDAPLHYHGRNKSVTKLTPPGMALGIDSGSVFDRVTGDSEVLLDEGDCVILYTDGVTEALDANGSEFGIGRLIEVVTTSATESASTIVNRVNEKVKTFVGNQPQTDDITLVVIRKI